MKVSDAMAHTISTASPDDNLIRVAELMRMEDAGFMPVCEGDRIIGVITDRDIVIRALAEKQADPTSAKARDFMTSQVFTVSPNDDLEAAARVMNEHEVRRLPVTENGRLIGILSHGNLVQALKSDGPADLATLGVTRGA